MRSLIALETPKRTGDRPVKSGVNLAYAGIQIVFQMNAAKPTSNSFVAAWAPSGRLPKPACHVISGVGATLCSERVCRAVSSVGFQTPRARPASGVSQPENRPLPLSSLKD